MSRIFWIAVLAVWLGAPSVALAQLDSGTGEVASRAVNTPLPAKHKPTAKKAHCGMAERSAKGGCTKPHR